RDKQAAGALFLFLATLLACGVAGVASRLLLGFERHLLRGVLFLLARNAGGLGSRSLFLAALLLGLGGIARQPGAFAVRCNRLAFGAALGSIRIVGSSVGAKFV